MCDHYGDDHAALQLPSRGLEGGFLSRICDHYGDDHAALQLPRGLEGGFLSRICDHYGDKADIPLRMVTALRNPSIMARDSNNFILQQLTKRIKDAKMM